MKADTYQVCLIASGVIVTALLGVFLHREIYPEYKIYQNDYVALEEFRSTYSHQPPPTFSIGVKQIVLERDDKGPPTIDRCTSCHVALQVPYFSPTQVAHDINGNIMRDATGKPILEPNEDYIWKKLDQKIAELRQQNKNSEAESYEALKTAHVGEHVYNVEKVLAMHPLIGKETRPFEYHPLEEYGCTSCHNGNGRGLVTDKAHGPVFDGEYEVEFRGFVPRFTEPDPDNDPAFARVFNSKPGHELLFQTQPLYVGGLIQAKCMQCHQTSDMKLDWAAMSASEVIDKWKVEYKSLQISYENDLKTLGALLSISQSLKDMGYQKTLDALKKRQTDYSLSEISLNQGSSQLRYLQDALKKGGDIEGIIQNDLIALIGSQPLVNSLEEAFSQTGDKAIKPFIEEHRNEPDAKGSLFAKANTLQLEKDLMEHVRDTEKSFQTTVADQTTISSLKTDIDDLTMDFRRGRELYLSQACYACHRISGFARGGVGPELTRIGESYPWYIKESIVWPQADLKTSTMPNMRLDHEELEDLMAFLLAQKGSNKAVAEQSYKTSLQSWEAGRKLSWEKPIPPAQMFDVNYGMTIFATEGCASCHRLAGFESNVGFQIEKEKHSYDELQAEHQWFRKLFPELIRIGQYDEELPGSTLVSLIEKNADEIDRHIIGDVRIDSLLEQIDHNHPEAIESLYSTFKYASRAKDHTYEELLKKEKDPKKRVEIEAEKAAWKERVHRVLMIYIQEYGLGRLIGPRPNWSGIYRSDEWLMEHFRNPTAHVPRSIMPAFPFDDTKFYALTYMLDHLGVKNRNSIRELWSKHGFDPHEAFERHCAQCHGIDHSGNGPVSQWVYPIPKNLHNPDFLRNLTKERAIYSIHHGVKGTPMPPWGEIGSNKPVEIKSEIDSSPVLTEAEISYLVDWLFSTLPGGEVIEQSKEVPKWQYEPEDVLKELKKEKGKLNPSSEKDMKKKDLLSLFPKGEGYYAAIEPSIAPSPNNEVLEVFDRVPVNNGGPDSYHYYIKKEYYTPTNLEQGKEFFLLNCAACHGTEADGSGTRSAAMQDAKPRMLTNLDWIQSRDDLRLLRSIKFGIPGTAMTPWGDLTSSLQRLQLVMFIRNLTEEQDLRSELSSLLYEDFDKPLQDVDKARLKHSELIKEYAAKKREFDAKSAELEFKASTENTPVEEALDVYKKSIEAAQRLNQLNQEDEKFLELKKEIFKEKDLYRNLGSGLILKGVGSDFMDVYFKLLKGLGDRYSLENGKLMIKDDPNMESQVRHFQSSMIQEVDDRIAMNEKQMQIEKGKISTPQINQSLNEIQDEISGYQKLKAKLNIDIDEALRSFKRQQEIVDQLYSDKEVHH